ncbi:RTA1-domain-containing protein [Gymnopilus junonius]|uniref:RTA1-domain-containing protein n=1 Tax=Gymnopilus junonius TaxID=109634 RepID=A0A9P5NNS2_GYMJU|nr:RTA1-domain-containing protein [Gymnopilus junonius]
MVSLNDISLAVKAHHAHSSLDSPYNYIPSEGVAITYIVLYGLSTLIHLGQAIYFQTWWLIPTVCLSGVLEILGWAARLWSSLNPPNPSPFEMQITCTIIGPTPLLAANFVILGILIQRLGPQYSRLTPRGYTILFCTSDVISLIVQAVGGGRAATAFSAGQDPNPGGHIMLGGISFQLAVIVIYALCAIEFYVRYTKKWPVRRIKTEDHPAEQQERALGQEGLMSGKITLMSVALLFSTTCLFIRSVYRTIELTDGWEGRIIGTQVLFNVLDGAMVTLAIFTINFAHPGLLLGRRSGFVKTTKREVEKGEKEAPSVE